MRATAPLMRKLPNAATKQILRTLFYRGHDSLRQAREALAIHWRPYVEHDGAEALVRQIEALDVADTTSIAQALPSLHIPARIVWGAADQFQRLRYGERFARDLKAPLLKIERGKHFTPEDHPQDLANAIGELLRSVQ